LLLYRVVLTGAAFLNATELLSQNVIHNNWTEFNWIIITISI